MKVLLCYCLMPLLLPHIFFFVAFRFLAKPVCFERIQKDVRVGIKVLQHGEYNDLLALCWLLFKKKEFRSVYYHRIGLIPSLFCRYLPGMTNLYIQTESDRIGGGLYIGHGWGTVINADSIGENCLIAQNVTIGSRHYKKPVIGDNVKIFAHAIVIGEITIGEGSSIGAGSVVVKDVPANCVVVPSKSCIIKQNGVRTNVEL